ncbi:MAG: helix-turn-helix domain-containing protein [Azospirillaceae bacterium]|nr:helix-turn-helix domain-containing protein [Azospirillaceae bacterium]
MVRDGEVQHSILIGARGMGKSSLLRRLAIAVKADEQLQTHFLPLRFREEQYNVISLDSFWRNCGEALADWCDGAGLGETAAALDRAIDSATWRDPEGAGAEFHAACARLGRRPLLLLDNLDLVLDGLKENDGWKLRRALQAPDGPVVIGAATRLLQQAGDREAPFYEFFHPVMLEPLTEVELTQCLTALAAMRGAAGAPVRAILAREPERLATLYTLTGGNPRILALIYQLLERVESETVFADLGILLDQVTPFYKARIEEYQTAQQRAVIDAIALNWDPITSNALATATGIEITTISSQLNRLKKDGLVEEVSTSGTRSGYQLAERFLNIWYLMRHGTRRTKLRLRWLTIVLSKLFTPDELGRLAAEARDENRACQWHPDDRIAVIEAFAEVAAEPRSLGDRALTRIADPGLPSFDVTGTAATTHQQIPTSEQMAARTLALEAIRLRKAGNHNDALVICDQLIERFGSSTELTIQEAVALALLNKAAVLDSLGRSEEALASYDAVVARFGVLQASNLRKYIEAAIVGQGNTLYDQLEQPDAAAKVYRRGLEMGLDATVLNTNLAWALLATDRIDEARALEAELSELDAEGLSLLRAGLAVARDNLGDAFDHLGNALETGLDPDTSKFFDDLLRLLRIATAHGHGERLLAWWQASPPYADRYLPVLGAFNAYLRGERFLLDLAPEIRRPAQLLLERLSPRRRRAESSTPASKRRGRPRKRPNA